MANLEQVHKMLEGSYSSVPQPQDTEKQAVSGLGHRCAPILLYFHSMPVFLILRYGSFEILPQDMNLLEAVFFLSRLNLMNCFLQLLESQISLSARMLWVQTQQSWLR